MGGLRKLQSVSLPQTDERAPSPPAPTRSTLFSPNFLMCFVTTTALFFFILSDL
ncbi:hypothetical protein T439DRAFT_321971 [Meredithblackwellia eburnea MCA 4105]